MSMSNVDTSIIEAARGKGSTPIASTAKPGIDECEREPIRVPGNIQPPGVLLTVHPADLVVAQVAGNTLSLLGMAPDKLLGQSLRNLPDASLLRNLAAKLATAQISARPSFAFHL